jgi:hypothetical protein
MSLFENKIEIDPTKTIEDYIEELDELMFGLNIKSKKRIRKYLHRKGIDFVFNEFIVYNHKKDPDERIHHEYFWGLADGLKEGKKHASK